MFFSNTNAVLGYSFIDDSGIKDTGIKTGHTTETGKVEKSIESTIGGVVQAILSFLGVVFLILMIYGGFLWMTAKGNEEQVTKAKNLIVAAIIGIIIVISAYAISYFVISSAGEKSFKFK